MSPYWNDYNHFCWFVFEEAGKERGYLQNSNSGYVFLLCNGAVKNGGWNLLEEQGGPVGCRRPLRRIWGNKKANHKDWLFQTQK